MGSLIGGRAGALLVSAVCLLDARYGLPRSAAAQGARGAVPSAAAVKARVEAGEGVPFFDERFSCREDGGAWSTYRELVDYSRLRIFGRDEGPELTQALADILAERTSNVSRVLQCNVGVIAGYHLLARRSVAEGDDWKAYRLLQLALIYVFTLRNALQVPEEAAQAWATRTDVIVQEIRLLRGRLGPERARRLGRLPQPPPSLRIPGLRIAVVSICAYPKDHPLVLRAMTPENRRAYAERHGYHLHVHMEHPLPDRGIHIQHAKLQLVAQYLRNDTYDWVAWLDCDSIIMNMNRTLDSIVYRYARGDARMGRRAAREAGAPADDAGGAARGAGPPPGGGEPEARPRGGEAAGPPGASQGDEPLEDEEVEAYVSHIGSCNTADGCRASTLVRVNPRASYAVTVSTVQVDMDSEGEKLASVAVGGRRLGECNPSPESDFDCGFFECFAQEPVPPEAVATGTVALEVHSVRTHSDCRCSRLYGTCYSAAAAAFTEAAQGEKTTDPGYGMFVKFVLVPLAGNSTAGGGRFGAAAPAVGGAGAAGEPAVDGCCCSPERPGGLCSAREALGWLRGAAEGRQLFAAPVRRLGAECEGPDVLLGISVSLGVCLQLCRNTAGCTFVAYGIGRKRGQCYWELGDCTAFEEDSYVVYDVGGLDEEGRPPRVPECTGACAAAAAAAEGGPAPSPAPSPASTSRFELEDEGVDLLITEEGWGLSSANWMIRRSNWSVAFLERAFTLCHEHMPLFGDQDAMINLLLNTQALRHGSRGDPLDRHAVVVPQRELNSYDALNAHYMGCDGYEDGDLLVTFPGCKEPQACNALFRLAFAHAAGRGAEDGADADPLARLRLYGPPELAASLLEAARKSQRGRVP